MPVMADPEHNGPVVLKPCPFCGGEAEVQQDGNRRQSCIVACTECGCTLGSNENGYGYHWNMRVDK